MKKLFCCFLSVIILSAFACGCKDNKTSAKFRLGFGIVSTVENSKDGTAQADITAAAVITDSKGIIVDCKIDEISLSSDFKDGVIDKNSYTKSYYTKHELGDNYGMRSSSKINAEWYEQADYFANSVKGMTAEGIMAIPTAASDNGATATDETLVSGCTIDISDFIKAVVAACNDPEGKTFAAEKCNAGLGMFAKFDTYSVNAGEEDGQIGYNVSISALATNGDGKISAVIIDRADPKIIFNKSGNITTNSEYYVLSNRILSDDYTDNDDAKAIKEWKTQIVGLEDYLVGTDLSEVESIEFVKDENGYIAKDETLHSVCSVSIKDYVRAVLRALKSIS